MVNSSEHGLARVVHHKDYYLRGGDMTVLVENHLYRIHSHFFERESLFFRQKFQSAEGEQRGSSDNNAYTLDDVKSEDFARFLWVFYNPKYSLYEAPLETWLSILHLANRWSFCNVKELTVRELERIEIDPVEKIAIYHEYSINKLFLIPSYIAVCKRDKPLSFAEGMRLGMETVLRVADARERARQHVAESGIRTPTFDDFEDNELETMVREVFGIASRPTSPIPQNNNSHSYNNGPSYTSSIKVNGTPAPKANGGSSARPNGPSIPEPVARPSARPTGTSIPDPTARSSVDTMRTFATAMESQPASSVSSSSNVEAKSAPLVPEQKPTLPEKPSPMSPEPTSAPNPPTPSNDQSRTGSLGKTNGMGEPSSVEGTKDRKAGFPDSSTTVVTPTAKHVVSTSVVKNNDENETNDHENDADKDETQSKDAELNSMLSDTEGSVRGGRQGRGRQQQRGRGGGAGAGAGAGGGGGGGGSNRGAKKP